MHFPHLLLAFLTNPEAHLSHVEVSEHDAQLGMHSVYFPPEPLKDPDPILANLESFEFIGTVMLPIVSLVRISLKSSLNKSLGKK